MNLVKKQKTANLLTMCIKAGKAVKGFDSVCECIKKGTAFCVLTAVDASEKTVKETVFICEKYNITHLRTELEKDEIGKLGGKQTAVLAICDKGFAKSFVKIAEQSDINRLPRK